MNPRPYQNDFITGVAQGFAAGHMRQLGVLPTGGGKTICFAHIANRFFTKRNERTLVLAHREELITQAADKIRQATGLAVSIERAAQRAERDTPVVVASVQTMQGKRLEGWDKDHFGLVVCDEAHHVLADSWQATLSHFNNARVLGVTATPDRGDKRNLATYFQNLAYECNIIDLISQGYLSPLLIKSVPLQIDLRSVRQTAGDYDAAQLDAAITPWLREIALYIRDNCQDRQKIAVFLPLIATSQRFAEICSEMGIPARHIDGASKDRAEILADYSAGKFRLLSNAMLLTEGWDEPGVDCVLVLRPTKSRSLFAQMVGRGTRLAPGKENCLLLDFLWLHERHDLARPASLVARTKEEEKSITEAILAGEDGKDLAEAIEDAAHEREAALIREIAENARKKERFLPVEHVAALLKDLKMREYEPTFAWETTAPSEKQRQVIERFNIKCPATKGEATMLMNKLFARSRDKLASVAQVRWLHRLNHPSPETATLKEAKAFLDSRWKKHA
jgi:superfamily II DNA or RNA helicase